MTFNPRRLIFLLGGLLCLILLAWLWMYLLSSHAPRATTRDWEQIKREGLLRMIVAPTTDSPSSPALLPIPKLIADAMLLRGIQVEMIPEVTRTQSLEMLAAGKCDIIAVPTIAPMEPWTDSLFVPLPTYRTETLYLLQPRLADSLLITTHAQLDSLTILLGDHGIEHQLLEHLCIEHHITLTLQELPHMPTDSLFVRIDRWQLDPRSPLEKQLRSRPLAICYGWQRDLLEMQSKYPNVHSDLPLTIALPDYIILRCSSPRLCDTIESLLAAPPMGTTPPPSDINTKRH